jgi:hypothetical protein
MQRIQFEVGRKYAQNIQGYDENQLTEHHKSTTHKIVSRTPGFVTVTDSNGWTEPRLKVFVKISMVSPCGKFSGLFDSEDIKKHPTLFRHYENWTPIAEIEYLKYREYNCRRRRHFYEGELTFADQISTNQ